MAADRPPESLEGPFRFLTRSEFDKLSLDEKMDYLRRAFEKLRSTNDAFRAAVDGHKSN